MASMSAVNSKMLMLFSGRGYPELAEEIGKHLGVAPTPMSAYSFANGELFVRYQESVRGCDAFVVQSMPAPINEWVMETLIMIDALKRGSAKRITVVLPFYPYGRQDKKHRGREPISARLVADLLKTAGADRILTVDLHTAQIQGFFDGPVDHLFAMGTLARYVEEKYAEREMAIVSPDTGRVRLAERWSDRLGGCPIAFVHKTRDPLKPNQVVAHKVVGDVDGRTCLLIDDMIDTAGTICSAAEMLKESGVEDIVIATTHPIMSEPAAERLAAAPVSEVIVTNTLPMPQAALDLEKITVLSIAPLVAKAIWEVFNEGSVTTLFGGLS